MSDDGPLRDPTTGKLVVLTRADVRARREAYEAGDPNWRLAFWAASALAKPDATAAGGEGA